MFQHNLLLIYRNFKRFKSTFFINLIGLSTGLTCTLLIYLWVNDEFQVDKFHEKDSRLFQVMEHRKTNKGIQTSASGLSAEALRVEMPQVEYAVTVTPPDFFPKFTLHLSDKNVRAVGKYVDKDFFKVFSYHLLQGNDDQVLLDKNAIVISEAMAIKLFKTPENIVGKTIEWQLPGFKRTCLVTGIFKDVPANATEQFDFVLTFEAFQDLLGMGKAITWNTDGPFHAFVVLKEGSNVQQFNLTLKRVMKSKNPEASNITLFLKRFSDNYLYGTYTEGKQNGGRIQYVMLFSIIAGFILVIASINFMNLSTAKASQRIKEIGVKKALGASRKTLILQYLGESTLMTVASLLIALLLDVLLLPQFNQVTGKHLTLDMTANLLSALLGITILTGLLAGSYPALYLSNFNPAVVLKGKFNSSIGELWTRKGLVVFQFTLSVIFIVAVLVVYKQIEFVQSKKLGYDKDNLIHFEAEGKVAEHVDPFLNELRNRPGIVNASSMWGYIIGSYKASGGNVAQIDWQGKKISYVPFGTNYGMLQTLGIELKAGRFFSSDFPTDTTKIIVNETLIDMFGLQNPVGKLIDGKEILGITKDFYFQSLHQKVPPAIFTIDRHYTSTVVVKLKAGMEKETIYNLKEFYQKYNPGFVFDYHFLDQDFQALYTAEKRVEVLSRYFAGLAILISCLGLFGLTAFTAERRRKEIGIRKVLGASELSIVYLLSEDFTRMVLVSILIALPASYLIVKHWLDSFAYRIDLTWGYFAGAGLLALLIAWVTVGTQAVKAAKINPAQCLRDE